MNNDSIHMATRKKKSKGFFDTIKNKATEAKITGEALSKIALEKSKEGLATGSEIGRKVSKKGTEGIEKGLASAKKATTSSNEMISLIEKLGKLKEAGLITDKEFQSKKKELLDKI